MTWLYHSHSKVKGDSGSLPNWSCKEVCSITVFTKQVPYTLPRPQTFVAEVAVEVSMELEEPKSEIQSPYTVQTRLELFDIIIILNPQKQKTMFPDKF